MKLFEKVVAFALLLAACAAVNSWIVNGPLLASNTEVAMRQFTPGSSAVAGDFKVGGYWLSFNHVYVVEALALVFAGFLMFVGDIGRLFVVTK